MTRFRIATAILTGVATVALLAGCRGANQRDLEGVPIKDPAKIEIYANIDGHPNIVRLCIDGVALMTTTREMTSATRVPEWDAWCKS